MSRHAPRGPVKARQPMDGADPMDRHCTATNRQGSRCKRYPIPGGSVCRMHGGAAPQVKAKAAERLMFMQCKALDTIDALMNREEFPTVQFQASKAVIDWTEGRAKERVELEVSGELAIVDRRLEEARKRLASRG